MQRSHLRRASAPFCILTCILFAVAAGAQSDAGHDKKLDVRSPVGDLHVGADADAKKAGMPLYPGAQPKPDTDNDNGKFNLGVLTEAFGLKVVVAKYESTDAPGKIADFYRDKLKKYGKVLECHPKKGGNHVEMNEDNKDSKGKELKCEGDNDGPVTELKVGTENNQHVVAIEPADSGKGATFALVYVYARGHMGEI